MRNFVVALAVTFSLLVGCTSEPVPTATETETQAENQIAIVDINEVARQIGAMDLIRQSMVDLEMEVKTKISQYKQKLDEEYLLRKNSFSDDLNQQAQDDLDQLLAAHQTSLAEQTVRGQNQLSAHHNQLKINLLNQVRPVAYEVASEKGMSIVLTTSQVYAAGPASDITDAVAKRIKELNTNPTSEDQPQKRVAKLPGGGEFKPH